MKKSLRYQLVIVAILTTIVVALAGLTFLNLKGTAFAQTVVPIEQWVSTSSPAVGITQRIFGKHIVISGLSDGCLSLSSHILTSSGIACGSGSGGGSSGGGLAQASPTEVPNGVVTVFTFASSTQPDYLITDNAWTQAISKAGTVNWTWSSGAKQATFSNPPQNDVVAIYIAGAPATGTFVTNEVVLGSGTSWTLVSTPVSSSVHLWAGGGSLTPGAGNDYIISGSTIITAHSYSAGQLLADYRI